MLQLSDGLTLTGHRPDGSLITTRHLPAPVPDAADLEPDLDATPPTSEIIPPQVLSLRDTTYVSTGKHLLMVTGDEPVRDIEFPSPITGLACTWPLIRPRIAVTHERGGFVVWGGLDRGHMQSFGSELPRPLVGFTREGALVEVAAGEGTVYDTHDRKVTARATFSTRNQPPIAVLPTAASNEFAVLSRSGLVQVFRDSG